MHTDIIISRAQNMEFTFICLYMHDDALIGLCIFQSGVRQVYSWCDRHDNTKLIFSAFNKVNFSYKCIKINDQEKNPLDWEKIQF